MTAELFKKFLERLEFNTVHSAFNLALTEYRESIIKMIDEKIEYRTKALNGYSPKERIFEQNALLIRGEILALTEIRDKIKEMK